MKNRNFRYEIAIPAMIIVLGVTIALLGFPKQSQGVVDALFGFMTGDLKFLYLLFGLFGVIFLIWISFSKYGNIRFGGPDAKKEFKNISWAAMIFCSGMGIGICYWAFVEPVAYFAGPPFGIEPFSAMAGEYSITYALFHWGFTPWGLYGLPTIAVAYAIHNKKMNSLSMSTASAGLLGKHAYGPWGKIIDICVVIALFGGLGTSLALGVPLVTTFLAEVFHMQVTLGFQIAVVIGWTLIFTGTVWAGLEKGISKLADLNTYLGLALLAFIFLVGPVSFVLDYFINGLGLLFTNFVRMSLWTDPIGKTGFVEAWTVFYWAWWTAAIPLMALFTARISKGRTIKQVALGMLGIGAAGCFAFFAVWGGYSMHLQMTGKLDVYAIYSEFGGPQAAVEIIKTLPAAPVILILFALLSMIFLSTTVNTGAYTIASTVTKHLKGDEQPGRVNRTIWGLMYGVYATSLFMTAQDSGSLNSIQLSSILTALPIVIISLLVCFSGMKWLKEDYEGILIKPEITIPNEQVKKVQEY